MKIDVRSKDVVYIELPNGKTIYIDDSTGECIVEVWEAVKKKLNYYEAEDK